MMENMIDYRYQLESPQLTGRRQQKTSCPACGRRKCFVRYVDTCNQFAYVDDSVGRCDHEQSCGYHYKPAQYFQDRPWLSESQAIRKPQLVAVPPNPLKLVPFQYVEEWHSPDSVFWRWFADVCRRLNIEDEAVRRVYEDYHIGATESREVVFWQIDELQRARSGHIMQYAPDGHRQGVQSWVHSRLIGKGLLSADFRLSQCLFGQHLLPVRPGAQVCVVEGEKTALLLAALCPEHLWLATCGCHGLTPEKVSCLHGRRVVLFPDSGCLEKWREEMIRTEGIRYTISNRLENLPHNTDLADVLLGPPG